MASNLPTARRVTAGLSLHVRASRLLILGEDSFVIPGSVPDHLCGAPKSAATDRERFPIPVIVLQRGPPKGLRRLQIFSRRHRLQASVAANLRVLGPDLHLAVPALVIQP